MVVPGVCAVLRLAHARTCAWTHSHGNASLGPQELGWSLHRRVRRRQVQHVASWDLAGAAVARPCLHGCQPVLEPVWVPTRASYGYRSALGGLLAIEAVLTSLRAGHKPHRGEQVRLLVPTARKVLASTMMRIIRSFDRSLRYNVGSYVCRTMWNVIIVC